MKTVKDFEILVRNCIEAAEDRYGKMPHIDIRCDIRARAAGWAENINGKLILRFNREMIANHWEHAIKDTIPHEVAHIVAFCFPELGAKNHNNSWKSICRSLGGSGERCHSLELSYAKKRNRHIYVTDSGYEVLISTRHHNKIQRGKTIIATKTKEVIFACQYKKTVSI